MIKNIEVQSNLTLAPIAGYFDSPFRRIARRHGAGSVCTELISADELVKNIKKTQALLNFHEEERPIGIQIYGRSPELLAEAALIAESYKPDFIDLNMGCPAGRIIKNGNGAGSALLLDPKLIEKIALKVTSSVKIPVTAKIRTGWDDRKIYFIDNLKALENGGISLITIHGRTRIQRHDGEVDWNLISEAATMLSLPVIGNGGITSYEDAIFRIESTKCSGIMIGQAAYGNPWIFSGKNPTISERMSLIEEHLILMIEHYDERGIILIRKHLAKYLTNFSFNKETQIKLFTSENKEEIIEIVNRILQN